MTRIKSPILALMMGLMTMPAWAVGTVNQSLAQIPGSTNYVFTENWTADAANGSIPATLMQGTAPIQGFRVVSVEVAPGSPAPTNGYAVTITSFAGSDVLVGAGANLSNIAANVLPPSPSAPPLFGSYTVNVTGNSVNSAQGRILVYFAPVSQIFGMTPAGAGLASSNLFTGPNTYSGASTFNGAVTTTNTGAFQGANTFSGTNSFSNTTTFTGATSFSNTNTLTGATTTTNLDGCQYVNASQTLPTAITAAGTSGCIVVSANYTMAASSTIPAGVSLSVQQGSTITTTGFTLTLNGPIVAGNYQIFNGSGTIAIGNPGNPINSLWFPGATMDVQANNAIASLTNGGFVDWRPYGQSTQTIAATITIGKGNKAPLTIFFDRATTFNCTITNSTPCITVIGNGTMMGFGTQASGSTGIVVGATSTVSNGLLVQGNQSTNQVGTFVEGLTVQSASGAVVSDALCALQNTLQLTKLLNVSCVVASTNTVGLKIYATGGTNGITNPFLDNISVDTQGSSGSRPIWIGCAASGTLTPSSCSNSLTSINFFGGLATHPGTGGLPIVTVEAQNGAGGTNTINNVNFVGFQMESRNTTDIGILDDGAASVSIHGLFASCNTNCGTDIIKVTQPAGTTLDGFIADGVTNGGWTNTFHSTGGIVTQTVTQAQCANGCGPYKFTKNGLTASAFLIDLSGTEQQIDGTGTSSRVFNSIETTAPAGIAANEVCYGDSTAHALKCNYNNTTFFNQTQTVGSGTATMTTALIASQACGTVVTVAQAGVATTDSIFWNDNAQPAAATNGALTIKAWPTSGNVNFFYCNPTAAGVTPAAATLNWRVVR